MAMIHNLQSRFTAYYHLTKPGIIRGNSIVAATGFLFGANGNVKFIDLLLLLVGTCLIIASACVSNNIIDRHIDSKMERTKSRALVIGDITVPHATVFALVLGIVGFFILIAFINALTAIIGLIGYIDYVLFYAWSKRNSELSTLIGSISGATPPVAGFTAATGHVGVTGIILFLNLVFWQMPHFYAIGLYRKNEYKMTGLPILTITKPITYVRRHIQAYIVGFGVSCILLVILAHASILFGILMVIANSYWFYIASVDKSTRNRTKWARKLFGLSLVILLLYCVLLSINSLIAS